MTATIVLLVLLVAGCSKSHSEDQHRPTANAPRNPDSVSIVAQFAGPESVQYYAPTDEYFVSNVNGDMADKDDNGFISRVRPDGSVENLKWIDGSSLSVTLHAPKGIATHGDTLFVTDIDSIRAFSISTGSPLSGFGVPGARFLNDLAISADGVLYATDTGLKKGMLPTMSDAVWRIDRSGPVPVAKGTWLSRPNGLTVGPEGVTVVTFGSKLVLRFAQPGAKPDTIATLLTGTLDGLVRYSADTLFVTSWDSKGVYLVDLRAGKSRPLFQNMESPADIGYDTKRHRLLIPLVNRNRIEIRRAP